MILAVESHYLLPPSVPVAAIWAGAIVACAVWAAAHWIPRPASRLARAVLAAGRTGVGFGAALAVAQAMQTVLLLATDWPVWSIALLAAAAIEAVVSFYRVQRKSVPAGKGWALLSLRVLLVALVAALLAQPVRSLQWSQRLPRFVAVVVDGSASMHVRDNYAPWEKVRLADAMGLPGVSRPYRMEATEADLQRLRDALGEEIERLDLLARSGPETKRRGLQDRRSALYDTLTAAQKRIEDQLERVSPQRAQGMKLDAPALAAMEDVRALLATRARDALKDASALAKPGASDDLSPLLPRILDSLRRAQGALEAAAPKLAALGISLDEAAYAALDPAHRQEVAAASSMGRSDAARAVLLARKGPDSQEGASILDRLEKAYSLRAYETASSTVEVRTNDWRGRGQDSRGGAPALPRDPESAPATRGGAGAPPRTPDATATSAPADDPTWSQQTDLAGAMRKVLTDLPADRIAGVLLLTEGRHNALGEDVQAAAQQLGASGVKVYPVPIGGRKPPTDAAIVSLDVPEVVFVKDKMSVTADLSFGGLAGKRVKVALLDDANNEVDSNSILVPSDACRARVQLAATPDGNGVHSYRVVLEQSPGEAFTANNEQSFTVSVTDDRIRVLLIDGGPRWEFRYLKNLFAGRDKTVRLQYVLFEPDRIPGLPVPPPVVASAAAPQDRSEATALPQTLEEWMKFDVVILGDVAPESLSPQDQESIRRFVTDRGGSLVVVSGALHMPLAYFGTPLADVLPVTAAGTTAPLQGAGSFRVALTAEGRGHLIPQLAVDPRENDRLWESMPELDWRLRGLRVKPGATVLAYAQPVGAATATQPSSPAIALPDPNGEVSTEQVRRYQSDNALLLSQSAGLGEVLMLTFDETWRLRYQAGDIWHHKFWGQVLRWASAGQLPSGTSLVKIGTDRARYWPGQRVRVRSRLLQPDLSPVKTAEVALQISRNGRPVSRRTMDYRPDSPGLWEADLGPLPPGRYQVELDSPAARDLLAAENVKSVHADFSVAAATPQEELELAPDLGLLNSLAQRTGGEVVEPSRLAEILPRLGPGEMERRHRSEYAIWSHWPLLALILVVATAEWLLRKKVGLA